MQQKLIDILNYIFQCSFQPDAADIQRDDVDGWDSVNHLRLVMELENAFGVTLSDEDVLNMGSLREILAVLARHGIADSGTAAAEPLSEY